jgi:uncharacterized protein YxjI
MAIALSCTCGKPFNLKDELLGKLVQCPACGATLRAQPKPSPMQPAPEGVDPAFHRDKFLLRQKKLAINEKYYVLDEQGKNLLFIERPRHFLRNFGATLAAVITFFIVMVAGIAAANSLGNDSPLAAVAVLFAVGLAFAGAFTVGIWLSKKRHVTIYSDDSKANPLLRIAQDQKFTFFVATFTISTPDENVLAFLRKNYLTNIFRKKWKCLDQDYQLKFEIMEDSIILSLLRRLLGPLFGLLRTNFIICQGPAIIGEFNRKLTLFDRYVLDLSRDREHRLDRRVALAIGVMLDSGERR